MKVYCFYRYDKHMTRTEYQNLINSGATIRDIHSLYAITLNKKHMRLFKKQRDMDKFVCIVHNEDKENLIPYLNAHSDAVLAKRSYTHYPYKGAERDMSVDIKILSTQFEYDITSTISDDGLFNYELIKTKTNPFILQDEYIKALTILEYISTYRFSHNKDWVPEEYIQFEYPEIYIDEFLVFIRQFKSTFK